ncbi:MAG TPA: ComEA family DNA-binding protein [Pseudonocardiaceae bacterium]
MKDQSDPVSARLAAVIQELGPAADAPWADTKAGRLVERWVPGGTRGVTGVRALVARHRFGVVVLAIVLVAAIGSAIVLSARQPEMESAPALPAAISAAPSFATTTASATPTTLVISVVGRVAHPGLVTLPDGSRVADALRAAGGVVPGTNDMALNLARRLADGEQIYVGIPVPVEAQPADPEEEPDASGAPTAKIDLNTATEESLETLPGVGPAMAQHILTWRTQHGHFDSISQLREVEGIGDGRYARISGLVTT